MADLYPVYMDIGGERKKVTAYKDIDGVRTLISSAQPETDVAPENCLTFSSAEAFTIGVKNATKNWDGTLEYSTDGTTWSEWDGTTAVASDEHCDEQRIYMRGSGNSFITGALKTDYSWVLTGVDVACTGNIETLLDYNTVAGGEHPSMANFCYCYLFRGCTSLTTAPELPATTLIHGCYYYMFMGCTSLTTAPELPATTLADNYCYGSMFRDCTGLTAAPKLPATTLAGGCYDSMFRGCTSLTTAPELPATTLKGNCYASMFRGCTSLTTAPELPATTLEMSCYGSMFMGCTSLTTVPKLPATTLKSYCYYYMFRDCSNIKLSKSKTGSYQTTYRIPTSGTGTTASSALADMFTGTGGTFTGTPTINTTYYTSNTVV